MLLEDYCQTNKLSKIMKNKKSYLFFVPPSAGLLDKFSTYFSLFFLVFLTAWLIGCDDWSIIVQGLLSGLGVAVVVDRFFGMLKFWSVSKFNKDKPVSSLAFLFLPNLFSDYFIFIL